LDPEIRETIRTMIVNPDLEARAVELGLVLCDAKPVAYFMAHSKMPSLTRVLKLVQTSGWAQVRRVSYRSSFRSQTRTYEELISKDAELIRQFMVFLHAEEPEKSRPGDAEQAGLLLGYSPASAHWYGYHRYYEGCGDLNGWSPEELYFGAMVHPKSARGLEAARLWSHGWRDKFFETYGLDLSGQLNYPNPAAFGKCRPAEIVEDYPNHSSRCLACRRLGIT
jgi:hypothetical protein